ncbi:hypothetical protein [Alicyclobacillus mengziensis]|uniref:Uncharacterized protein n=1 Tax=Alicyclobacillus mengziensis TaxID=2931921 RepID=A0A9X7Z4R5_9BACL|nr:hypothetical protein [Alicyclobacillus mengziensis]QSO45632.1 hypothetical protein JZ786_13810 [Alicyclobacillus mengziensis]
MAKDVYLQPVAPDPIHSDEVVLAIVRKHVPDTKKQSEVSTTNQRA